jgi:hypothetical protein
MRVVTGSSSCAHRYHTANSSKQTAIMKWLKNHRVHQPSLHGLIIKQSVETRDHMTQVATPIPYPLVRRNQCH